MTTMICGICGGLCGRECEVTSLRAKLAAAEARIAVYERTCQVTLSFRSPEGNEAFWVFAAATPPEVLPAGSFREEVTAAATQRAEALLAASAASPPQTEAHSLESGNEQIVSISTAGDAPKTAALFTPEMVEAISKVSFGVGADGWSIAVADLLPDGSWEVAARPEDDESEPPVESGLTREQAIRRAFELSQGGAK